MKGEVLSNFDMPWLPISGLLIFFICFCVYTYWTFKKENKDMYDQVASLPLHEESK